MRTLVVSSLLIVMPLYGQQKSPTGSPDPNKAEATAQASSDPCTRENILHNMDIGNGLMNLYGTKKPEDVQVNDDIWNWAESTYKLIPCLSSQPNMTTGIYLVKVEALEVQRLFLLSAFAKLNKENESLKAELQKPGIDVQGQADAQRAAIARKEATDRRNLLLGMFLMGMSRPVYQSYQLPQPARLLQLHCETRNLFGTAYTDCQ